MAVLRKSFAIISIFFLSHAFAQGQPENTMRAGSGGSAGTTQQGPVYDGGIVGPNSAMGAPDITAVDREGEVRSKRSTKKPIGTIRVDAEGAVPPEQTPNKAR